MANRITISLTAQQAMGADISLLFGVDDGYNWVEGLTASDIPANGPRPSTPLQC